MQPILHPVTADDLARMGEEGRWLELVRGELREMVQPRSRHGLVTNTLQVVLSLHVNSRKMGRVFGSMGFLIERNPDTVLAPDCAFIRTDRIPDPMPDVFFPFAPDLAVEVLSPGDRPGAVREKTGLWLGAGVRTLWIIDPARRTAAIHRPSQEPRILQDVDLLDGEDVVPGFQIIVSELFQ